MDNLSNVNNFLKGISKLPEPSVETTAVVNSPDVIKNILISEISKVNKLDQVTAELLHYLTDGKAIKNLSYKEKQSLLRDVVTIHSNSRDFIFKVAELTSKNEFLKKILEINEGSKQLVKSSNGETYISSIDDDKRRNLTEILRNVINDRCHEE